MDIGELKERLLDDQDVQPGLVEQTAEQIQNFGAALQKEFYEYLKGRELPGECQTLVQQYGLRPVGAFIMCDWLEKEPDAAKLAVAYLI